ncbi:MAG: LacI family DNA-binding transcriptional regulator [Oscillospiraceae bacterium]|nr:LacI family DNA-binding transcriptional regulator [Oscillospiraceae bacterium]
MTIKDIAQLSGYGVGTVSRVLNNHPAVSEEARKKVQSVVAEHSFQLNTNAKHLKQLTSSNIAILVKGTQNLLFADILEQIQSLLRDSDRETSVYYLDEDANEVVFAIQLCREHKPQGVLFLGGDMEYFQSDFIDLSVPCVLLTNIARELNLTNLSSLSTDDTAAAARAIDFLIERGHRHIGVLGGNWSSSQISYRRIIGCCTSFEHHGIPFDKELQCEPCRFSMQEAYAATGRLLDRNPDMTAIFAMSDVMAIGVIRAICDRGKRVPEDISVIGYDGISSARYSVPRLATIQQDTCRLAERGTEILLRSLEAPTEPIHELVPFGLILGESVITLAEPSSI